MGSGRRTKAALVAISSALLWTGAALMWSPAVARAEGDDYGETDRMLDSDGDGLWDVEEDENQNHRVDDGEERDRGTDPAHNGLIDFPEPMVFDMVRGLGAEQGEIEVNALVLVPTSPAAATWAPEIEAAVVDNFAIELEVGFYNIDLEILKLAFQGTVGMKDDGSIAHGIQPLFEYAIVEF